MDLIIIFGAGAVGKMTVGQELMKITDFRLFHNHMMIEPVIEIFGNYEHEVVAELRETIFRRYLETSHRGMIFTFMWAFDMKEDWDYIADISSKFEKTGGRIYYVELVADISVRLARNKTENRILNKASKRDTEASEARLIHEDGRYRLVSLPGEIPFKNYLRLDNTNLSPAEAAETIKRHFDL